MTDPTSSITVTPDGPYVVRGVPLVRRRIVMSDEGESVTWQTTEELEVGDVYALCRCGQSRNKPFCDLSHVGAGFVADGA